MQPHDFAAILSDADLASALEDDFSFSATEQPRNKSSSTFRFDYGAR